MTQVIARLDKVRNGVDPAQLFGTLDAVKAQPELGEFQFRVRNRWIGGAHNRSQIQDFYAAGGEDASRDERVRPRRGRAADPDRRE